MRSQIVVVAIFAEVSIVLIGFGWDLMNPTNAKLGPWLMFLGIIIAVVCCWVYYTEVKFGNTLQVKFDESGESSDPQFGYPWQTYSDENLVEWSILVSVPEPFERCEIVLFGEHDKSPGSGISLRWRTRDGETSLLTLDPHKPYYAPLFARWEPHADKPSDIEGAAIICNDNYFAKAPPFSLIKPGVTRAKFQVELRSVGREWRSPWYLITVPKAGRTNGAFILMPEIVMS